MLQLKSLLWCMLARQLVGIIMWEYVCTVYLPHIHTQGLLFSRSSLLWKEFTKLNSWLVQPHWDRTGFRICVSLGLVHRAYQSSRDIHFVVTNIQIQLDYASSLVASHGN